MMSRPQILPDLGNSLMVVVTGVMGIGTTTMEMMTTTMEKEVGRTMIILVCCKPQSFRDSRTVTRRAVEVQWPLVGIQFSIKERVDRRIYRRGKGKPDKRRTKG